MPVESGAVSRREQPRQGGAELHSLTAALSWCAVARGSSNAQLQGRARKLSRGASSAYPGSAYGLVRAIVLRTVIGVPILPLRG